MAPAEGRLSIGSEAKLGAASRVEAAPSFFMPALVVHGTASGVGKSTLVTALCRLLRRRGLRVAPFKAVNMSLNSAVTPDGREIGRSQAVQARAAGLEPRAEMNPVLLKPGPRRHAVVLGRPSARRDLWPVIRRAYRSLAKEFEVVVIEGMGSPAEPNLMARDLANLRIAREARAASLLVGDIDHGGVFASLLGTWQILAPKDRPRAFVINKFRGARRALSPAIRFLERRTRVPVAGVLPWLDLTLDEEDTPRTTAANGRRLRIAVVRLPHLSNSTDFEPLQREPDVDLVYASRPVPCDALIFPGTRATLADLAWARDRGFGQAARETAEVVGICGGMQMLGREIRDGVESGARDRGLGFFDCATTFARGKKTVRVRGRHAATGEPIEGYEIHLGRTRFGPGRRPFAVLETGHDGIATPRGWGTYVHGVFDAPGFRRAFLNRLRARRGWRPLGSRAWSRDSEIDRLADAVGKSLDMDLVMSLLWRGRVP
jgi:adenosylcobyric acid synthase